MRKYTSDKWLKPGEKYISTAEKEPVPKKKYGHVEIPDCC
jgi:hypothetical protein